MPRRRRPLSVSGFAVAALALSSLGAAAQTPLFDSGGDLLQPAPNGNSATPPLFQTPNTSGTPPQGQPPPGAFTPSRIGATPTYGSPPGFGAGDTGFDSTNTGRRKKQATPAPPAAVPGQAQPESTFEPVPAFNAATPPKPPAPAPPTPPDVHPLKAASRPGAVLPPVPDQLPVSNPPPQIYPAPAANRPGAAVPIPPPQAFAPSAETPPPGTPPLNTLPPGIAQRPLPLAVDDPYAALGLREGSFLLYPAVEISGGYSSNPQSAPGGSGSWMYVVAPELRVQSDWSRHSLTANIVGTYNGYSGDMTPSLNRPYLDATVDGRIDVLRNTQVLLEGRYLVSTDNPGSPNLQAGLAKLPIYNTVGATLGLQQEFNRLQVTVKGTVDRSTYANSVLTDGEVASNDDRNFDQYGGTLRVGYELNPGFKPFAEIGGDERIYDLQFDSAGLQRNSTGTSAKLGADINFAGSLTGEFAGGYLERTYVDPSLPNIGGVIADGSLLWQISPLTTAKFTAASTVTESILSGTSGEFSRDFNVQADHAFLLWIIGTLQAGYGHDNYVGLGRQDNRYFVSTGLTYKLNRELQLKGTVRQDWLTSNVTGVAYNATSFLLGLRLQR